MFYAMLCKDQEGNQTNVPHSFLLSVLSLLMGHSLQRFHLYKTVKKVSFEFITNFIY